MNFFLELEFSTYNHFTLCELKSAQWFHTNSKRCLSVCSYCQRFGSKFKHRSFHSIMYVVIWARPFPFRPIFAVDTNQLNTATRTAVRFFFLSSINCHWRLFDRTTHNLNLNFVLIAKNFHSLHSSFRSALLSFYLFSVVQKAGEV